MSNNQIADMGRGMRDVAKSTGLTGEALKGVVDSSMQFVDQMRKAATLSSSASKNIFELGANAKKLGVEEEMNKLIPIYLNRLSDLLFVMARYYNKGNERLWQPMGEMNE